MEQGENLLRRYTTNRVAAALAAAVRRIDTGRIEVQAVGADRRARRRKPIEAVAALIVRGATAVPSGEKEVGAVRICHTSPVTILNYI